jgi:hypothetical protein
LLVLGYVLGGIPALVSLAAGFAGWRYRQQRAAFLQQHLDIDWLNKLSWQDFERQVGEVYRQRGYQVEEVGGGGADGGVDLRLRRDGTTAIVQCKRWKTYAFRNTSNRAFVVSGGKATPATLFYNKASRKLGVVGLKHVVFFDEIANTRFDDVEASISVLKDYMQTGKFSRGDQEFSAPCSIVLGGNIDTNLELRQPAEGYRHLFQVLPVELQDPAFLDRIHAYLCASPCGGFCVRPTSTWKRSLPVPSSSNPCKPISRIALSSTCTCRTSTASLFKRGSWKWASGCRSLSSPGVTPPNPASVRWPVVPRPTFLSQWMARPYWVPSLPLSRTHLTSSRRQQRTSPVDEARNMNPILSLPGRQGRGSWR